MPFSTAPTIRAFACSAAQPWRPRRWTYGQATVLKATSAVATTSSTGGDRAVFRPLAEELDEGMQVVGRRARRRLLMERLVGRQHQRQVPVEQIAERLEPPLEPLAARAG